MKIKDLLHFPTAEKNTYTVEVQPITSTENRTFEHNSRSPFMRLSAEQGIEIVVATFGKGALCERRLIERLREFSPNNEELISIMKRLIDKGVSDYIVSEAGNKDWSVIKNTAMNRMRSESGISLSLLEETVSIIGHVLGTCNDVTCETGRIHVSDYKFVINARSDGNINWIVVVDNFEDENVLYYMKILDRDKEDDEHRQYRINQYIFMDKKCPGFFASVNNNEVRMVRHEWLEKKLGIDSADRFLDSAVAGTEGKLYDNGAGHGGYITYLYSDSYNGNADNATQEDIEKNIKALLPFYRLGERLSPEDANNMIFELLGGEEPLVLKVTPTREEPEKLKERSNLFIQCAKREAILLNRIADERYIGAILGTYVFCNKQREEKSVFIIERKYEDFKEYWHKHEVNEKRVCRVISAVLRDINYIHEFYSIIHRDIKPGNLVVKHDRAGEHVLLIDFNFSREIDFYRTNSGLTVTGTAGFVAPEVLSGHYDHRADIYSVGVLAYYLFTNTLPAEYRALSEGRSKEEIEMIIYEALKEAGASEEFATIIFKAMRYRADDRYSSAQEMHNEMARKLSHLGDDCPQLLKRIPYYYSEYEESKQIHWIGEIKDTGVDLVEIEENPSGAEKQMEELIADHRDFVIALQQKNVVCRNDSFFESILYFKTKEDLKNNDAFAVWLRKHNADGYPLVFKRYDVITFDEKDKVVVLDSLLHKGVEYVFVNEILPDESNVTNVYKIMRVFGDGTLETVVDPVLLHELSPVFQKRLEKYAK